MNQLTSWQQLWDRAQPVLSNAEQSLASTASPVPRILRVGQLDAELLDVELVSLLRDPLSKALGLVNVHQSLFCAVDLRSDVSACSLLSSLASSRNCHFSSS